MMVEIEIFPAPSYRGTPSVIVQIEDVSSEQLSTIRAAVGAHLAKMGPSDAVAQAFVDAVTLCPLANPSDVWQHIVYRTVLSLGYSDQQWKRISGFALERAISQIYNPRLEPHNIAIWGPKGPRADAFLSELGLLGVVKRDKVDLVADSGRELKRKHIAALHVKASLAERIQDDVPASRALMEKGLLSIALTLDSKSFPPPHGNGVNYGELGGRNWNADGDDRERIKRQYVEKDGQFDALISFNLRTPPSPETTASGKKIHVMTFFDEQPDLLVRLLKERADQSA